jgi:aminoethylphosphonate catabolism LysR family transcriptional regulator
MIHAHLRSFHAVASEGSFTRAAARLGVTQPTLSAQVKALEERYGVALFDRRGRGVATTGLGAALLEITRRLFLLEEEAEELLGSARALTTGHLRVGADSPYHAVPFLAAFAQRYPAIHVALSIGNAEEVMARLFRYESDVAVVADIAEDPRLERVLCAVHRLVVFVPRSHPWAGRKAIRLGELEAAPMVLREEGSKTRRVFEAALAAAGVKPRPVIEIESREAVREAVAAGLGLGVVSAAEFGHDERLITLPVRDATLETREYLIALRERRKLRLVSAFFDEALRLIAPGTARPGRRDGRKQAAQPE